MKLIMETKEQLLNRIQELEHRLDYYQDYDGLTGIYNKETFYQLVSQCLKIDTQKKYQIVCIDIQQFKLINDTYGVQAGDEVLVYVAGALQSLYEQDDYFCARASSDIFYTFLPAELGGEKYVEKVVEVFQSIPLERNVNPAIGIYAIVDDTSVHLMCDRAFIAVESTKGLYQKNYAWYNEEMRHHLIQEQELMNGAEAAINQREFIVYIQPKCNMATGRVIGGEALVRWQHPQKGMIAPYRFISLFEKTGFIKKLDQFVWEEVVKFLSQRYQKHENIVPISVNVSRIDLLEFDVPAFFKKLIQKYQIDPQWIEIEITESAYIYREKEVIEVIDELMRLGFKVLMDDFGSGYSSLNILKDINIDTIKLDMRFLDNQDHKSQNILESVIHMAKWLDLKVIAEGVEKAEQVQSLLKIGCVYAQGFYYYRPMPIDDFIKLLHEKDKIDFDDQMRVADYRYFTMKDILHEDSVSEQLLNHILGAVALYSRKNQKIELFKYNEAYRELMHIHVHEDLSDIRTFAVEEDEIKFENAFDQVLEHPHEGITVIIRRQLPSEKILWIQLHLFFLTVRNDEEIFYASLMDVSEHMEIIEELRLSEQRFRVAMESSYDTIFELDINTHMASFSIRSMEDFGYEKCVMKAPEGFLAEGSVLPEYVDEFVAMYDAIYHGEAQASCTIQARMADNQVVWNNITITAIKDNQGNSLKAVGLVRNVTKELELIKQ